MSFIYIDGLPDHQKAPAVILRDAKERTRDYENHVYSEADGRVTAIWHRAQRTLNNAITYVALVELGRRADMEIAEAFQFPGQAGTQGTGNERSRRKKIINEVFDGTRRL